MNLNKLSCAFKLIIIIVIVSWAAHMVQVCCPTILFTHWGGKATKRVTIQHNKKMVIAKASHCASYKMRLRTQTAFYPDATNTAYVYLVEIFYYCVYVLLFTLTSLAQVLSLSLSHHQGFSVFLSWFRTSGRPSQWRGWI